MIRANDPNRKSWVAIPSNSDFSIQNLPFGIFSVNGGAKKVGVAIGDFVLDLSVVKEKGLIPGDASIYNSMFLNDLIAEGKTFTRELRNTISDLLLVGSSMENMADEVLVKMEDIDTHLAVRVGDYTDFYSSEQHAYNVGCLFRDPNNALLPNWKHIPVGYHGRASSIVNTGVAIRRPKGQMKPPTEDQPIFGPSRLLDFELETAFITFPGKPLGDNITTEEADDFIFGKALLNDWSARDIQGWEYVPLGPFLGKNFATCMSPWIVTLDALEPFRTEGPVQDPKVLPYLEYSGNKHINIKLEVLIQPEGSEETVVGTSNYKYMYWNMNQQLAHHTINGCNINGGDVMGSGTISGPSEGEYGSMLETSWKGTKSVPMKDGSERKFIQDNDTVIMRGYAEKDGVRVGFGEVSTRVLPAK